MKNLLKILGCMVALILFMNFSCDVHDAVTLLTLHNNSDMTVVAYLTNNYPDTLIPITGLDAYSKRGISNHYVTVNAWNSASFESNEKITKQGYFQTNDTFQIFVIKREFCPITNYDVTIDDVYKNNWLLRRYEFTREQLEQMDWTVVYP